MEILDKNAGLLSNFEVLQVVREVNVELSVIKEKFSDKHVFKNTEKVEKFLSDSPCGEQTPEKIKSFLKQLTKYKLKPSEKLQILNMCPTQIVDLHILIEGCENRFPDEGEEKDEILELVKTHLCSGQEMSSS